MNLKIGFSPCPNDTFIFDALINRRIATGDFEFTPVIADVEQLNEMSFESQLDITKVSFHTYAYISGSYSILSSGCALGFGNGPLVISRKRIYPDELTQCKIAIPGKYTTANLLFSIAYPEAGNKRDYLFSDIEQAILEGEVDAGVIIHENRFTYKDKGLQKITDLGEYWEEKTKSPVPLGCIAVKRSLPGEVRIAAGRLMKDSVLYALENPAASSGFVMKYASEMEPEVLRKHIELYVNEFTVELGSEGRNAIQKLFEVAFERKIIPALPEQYL